MNWTVLTERFVPQYIRRGRRVAQISKVLFKHGFFHLIQSLELTRYLPSGMQEKLKLDDDYQIPTPERVRRVFEDLGPTYVKLGQILSTRPDIFPRPVIQELAKLQDFVPPFPYEDVQKVFMDEFNKPIEEIFEHFSERTIASASIGQVHVARLLSGDEVVVKVQRPGIKRIIDIDIDIMRTFAVSLENRYEWARMYNLVERVEEFTKTINEELDYNYEGKNADRFAKNMEDEPRVKLPRIYWEYTSTKVLTMEFIHGIKIKDVDQLRAKGWDLANITHIIADSYIKMILLDGFFHGDPHPGNIFVIDSNTIALIDFGMVGSIDAVMKRNMARYFVALVNMDAKGFTEVLDTIADIDPETDRKELARQIGKLMLKYSDVDLGSIRLEELVPELMDLGFKYRITLPGEFTLMDKTLITLEGLGRLIDPTFDLVGAAQPVARMLFERELSMDNLQGAFLKFFIEFRDIFFEFPERVNKWYNRWEERDFKSLHDFYKFDERMERFTDNINRFANRLSLSILAAALFIGISITGLFNTRNLVDIQFWFVDLKLTLPEIMLTLCTVLVLGLLYGIYRSGKKEKHHK